MEGHGHLPPVTTDHLKPCLVGFEVERPMPKSHRIMCLLWLSVGLHDFEVMKLTFCMGKGGKLYHCMILVLACQIHAVHAPYFRISWTCRLLCR